MKKDTYPISLLVKTSHKKFEDPQNDKKIEKFIILKYKNKRPSKFTKKKSKYPISPLVKLHTKQLKTPKTTRRKLNIPKF